MHESTDPDIEFPRRATLRLSLAVTCALCVVGASRHSLGSAPDPRAIIQGVENARLAIPSGRMEWELDSRDYSQPKSGVDRTRLVVVFDGGKRRFDQYQRIVWYDGTKPGSADAYKKLRAMGGDREEFVRAGLGEFKDVHVRSAFDDSQFMQYNKEMGAFIRDPSQGSVDYVFDPRIMGISVWYDLKSDVPGVLGYRDAKSITMVGAESIGGKPTWHVLIVDKSDRGRHFWVDDRDFRVYKVELRSKYQHYVSLPEYDDRAEFRALPARVILREYGRDGTLNDEKTFTLKNAKEGPVDPKNWTLAGLGIPLGEMVIDERIHRVVGHWDGDALNPSFTAAMQKGEAARWKPLHWGMVVTGGVVLAVLAAVVARRKNWLRAEA